MYDPNQTSETLARQLAYVSGRMDIVTKLEAVIRTQEKKSGHI